MYCRNCGAENPDDATFCQKCGADLKNTSTTSTSSTASSSAGAGPSQNTYIPPSYSGANPMPTSINVMGAIKHAIDLMRNPAGVMSAYRDNDSTLNSLMINYVVVLAGLAFVATLIGNAIFYGFFVGGVGVAYAFVRSILDFIFNIVAVFIVGYVLWKLAPSFATTTTQIRATRLAAYSYTPYLVISLLNIIPYPAIDYIDFLGVLYGLYIVYLGLPIMLGTPKQSVISYLVVSIIVVFVVYAVLTAIISIGLGFAFFR